MTVAQPFKGQEPGTWPPPPPHPKHGPAEAVYLYKGAEGEPLFYVCRYELGDGKKTFLQGHYKRDAKWVWNLRGVTPVLYRLPAVRAHLERNEEHSPLYLVEGEKAVEYLRHYLDQHALPGEVTCNPMGAGKWQEQYTDTLRGARYLVLVADNDTTGFNGARKVREELAPHVGRLELVRPAVQDEHAGVDDHLAAGLALEDLVPLVEYEPGEGPVFLDVHEFVRVQVQPPAPLLGTQDVTVIPQGGLVIVAGRPGAAKTTAVVDMACHLAAGLPWPPVDEENERAPKPWPVERPLRIAFIENEGPLEMFRAKLERKLRVFGHELPGAGGYLGVQVWRWGAFSFADPDAFGRAAHELDELQVDLVVGDPLGMLGVEGVGSPADTRDFVMRLRALGLGTHRAFLLIHHFRERAERTEDELARISGAWGGHLDTLMTIAQAAQADQVRLAYPKLRWAREATPNPIILGKVYARQGFEAIAEEHDTALLEPQLVEVLQEVRTSGGGYKGWMTSNTLAERASLGRKAVRATLEGAPHLFAMRTGELARELGAKNRTSKLYGLVEWPEAPSSGPAQPELEPGAGEGAVVVPLRPEEAPATPDHDGDIPW